MGGGGVEERCCNFYFVKTNPVGLHVGPKNDEFVLFSHYRSVADDFRGYWFWLEGQLAEKGAEECPFVGVTFNLTF